MSPRSIELAGRVHRLHRSVASAWWPRGVVLSAGDGGFETSAAAFDVWCAGNAGASCDLAMSSAWMRSCVAPIEAGTMTPHELRDYALRQFEHYFGEMNGAADEDWVVAVSRDRNAPIACGMPGAMVGRLQAAARRHRVALRRIAPWWAAGVARALRQHDGIAAIEPGLVTRVQARDGRVCRIGTEFGDATTDDVRQRLVLWPAPSPMPLVCDGPAIERIVRGRAAPEGTA